MIKIIHDSLVFRLPSLIWKNLVTYIMPNKLKSKPLAPEFNFVILCGPKDYPLLKQALFSIRFSFKKLPHLYIVTDFDMSAKTLTKIVKLYPADKLLVIKANECVKYHENNGNSLIKAFAMQSPMGLKIAAIAQVLDIGTPVLYADTDVLWFNDPFDDIAQFISGKVNIHMSPDFHPGYDFHLIKKAGLGMTVDPPYYNAGLMFIKNITEEQHVIMEKLLSIIIESHNSTIEIHKNLSEQTLFAFLQKEAGPSDMLPDRYLLFTSDQYDIIPTWQKHAVARHYIGQMRHLFWRDAFFKRIRRL